MKRIISLFIIFTLSVERKGRDKKQVSVYPVEG